MPENNDSYTSSEPIKYVWEQWENESNSQYQKFLIYCDVREKKNGKTEYHSYQSAYQEYKRRTNPEWYHERIVKNKENPPASGGFMDLAQKFEWYSRRQALLKYQQDLAMSQIMERRIQAIVETVELGEGLRKKAQELLNAYTIPENIWASEIITFAKTGVELERLALGDPTSIIQQYTVKQSPDEAAQHDRNRLKAIQEKLKKHAPTD